MRAGLGIIALSLAVPAVALAQTGRPSIRFADLDGNHDGVITRAEWRGNDRSFQVHDWNGDGILSGEEVRPDARRATPRPNPDWPYDDQVYTDWTPRAFANLDHNRDDRLSHEEWHADLETFRRVDHNRDGYLSRAEFLGTETSYDDDRDDRLRDMDDNRDGGIDRGEWHGSPRVFDSLDDNHDGRISGRELQNEPPPELFTSIDVNRNGTIDSNEWHWSESRFATRDVNHDGRLTRAEFERTDVGRSAAYRAGADRGLIDGRAAGREDRERNQGWDLDGQRELETADAGYESRMGSRDDYRDGYREAFRRGYREGYGNRS